MGGETGDEPEERCEGEGQGVRRRMHTRRPQKRQEGCRARIRRRESLYVYWLEAAKSRRRIAALRLGTGKTGEEAKEWQRGGDGKEAAAENGGRPGAREPCGLARWRSVERASVEEAVGDSAGIAGGSELVVMR